MKNQRTLVVCICLSLLGHTAFAQNEKIPLNEPDLNRPKLFSSLPDNIVVTPANLDDMMPNDVGVTVHFTIGQQVPFEGKLVSVAHDNDSRISSYVLRSSNYPGAVLTISKAIVDGKEIYSGRLLSMQHADLYELQLKNGQYIFIKKNYYDLINE